MTDFHEFFLPFKPVPTEVHYGMPFGLQPFFAGRQPTGDNESYVLPEHPIILDRIYPGQVEFELLPPEDLDRETTNLPAGEFSIRYVRTGDIGMRPDPATLPVTVIVEVFDVPPGEADKITMFLVVDGVPFVGSVDYDAETDDLGTVICGVWIDPETPATAGDTVTATVFPQDPDVFRTMYVEIFHDGSPEP